MEIKYYLHVFLIILIVIGAGIAFNAVQNQASMLTLTGSTTTGVVVSASAYLLLISSAVFVQWFAYYFHQNTTS